MRRAVGNRRRFPCAGLVTLTSVLSRQGRGGKRSRVRLEVVGSRFDSPCRRGVRPYARKPWILCDLPLLITPRGHHLLGITPFLVLICQPHSHASRARQFVMSSPRHPVLTFDGGPRDGETAPIDKPVTKLGRMDDNDVVTKGAGVSRQHATIMQNDEGCWLTDLNSRNGTFINGRNISAQRQQLHHGDHIRLGTSTVSLIFRHDESETVTLQISAPPGRGG